MENHAKSYPTFLNKLCFAYIPSYIATYIASYTYENKFHGLFLLERTRNSGHVPFCFFYCLKCPTFAKKYFAKCNSSLLCSLICKKPSCPLFPNSSKHFQLEIKLKQASPPITKLYVYLRDRKMKTQGQFLSFWTHIYYIHPGSYVLVYKLS